MMKFDATISTANAGMAEPADLADALRRMANMIDDVAGFEDRLDDQDEPVASQPIREADVIRDVNGNTVGNWAMTITRED